MGAHKALSLRKQKSRVRFLYVNTTFNPLSSWRGGGVVVECGGYEFLTRVRFPSGVIFHWWWLWEGNGGGRGGLGAKSDCSV